MQVQPGRVPVKGRGCVSINKNGDGTGTTSSTVKGDVTEGCSLVRIVIFTPTANGITNIATVAVKPVSDKSWTIDVQQLIKNPGKYYIIAFCVGDGDICNDSDSIAVVKT